MNKRRPIVLCLCSVIIGAFSVVGVALFTPARDGNPTPPGQVVGWLSSLAVFAASVITGIASLVWLLVAIIRKPN